MQIEISCPSCSEKILLVENTLKCPNKGCGYSFKAFEDNDEAQKFHDSQPSIAPRYIIPLNGHWVVAYRYENIARPSISQLSELISKETLSNLLRGFGKILNAPLHIYERIDKGSDPREIQTEGLSEFYAQFCKEVQQTQNKNIECDQCNVNKVQQMFSDNKKESIFNYCWLGRRKKFVPIVINNFLYGVLVCGEWQRNANIEDENNIKNGIQNARDKLGIECGFDKKGFFSDKELALKEKEITSIKNQLESLGNTSYKRIRYERDWDFIREIDAIFAMSPITTHEMLWDRLYKILKRFAEFCAFEACILLFTEPDNQDDLLVKSQYPENFISEGKIRKEDRIVSDLLINKKNIFTNNPQEVGSIGELIEKNYTNKINVIGVCTLDLHKEKALLIVINRSYKDGKNISKPSQEFIIRFVSHLVPIIRNILSLIELQKVEKERQELIMLTVHTLNHTMDGIIADSELLESLSKKGSPIPIDEFLLTAQNINERVTILAGMTKTFYYSTVINAGKNIDFRFDKSFSILELLKKCKDKFVFFAKQRGISVSIEEPRQKLPDIIGDKEKIEIVFDNLVHNAIKFSHNSKDVKIRIYPLDTIQKVIVYVNNFGFGIPSDEKERIFMAFRRSTVKDSRRPIPGTGLGLTIAKNIVDAHHGSIKVTSKREKREYTLEELSKEENWEGFNTTFSVNLPVNPKFLK